MTDEYRQHHYVPQWYQARFLKDAGEKKFYYLDLKPEVISAGAVRKPRRSVLRWGTRSCFRTKDLYTVEFGGVRNVEIEKYFFGQIDADGAAAVDHFSTFTHPNWSHEAFDGLLRFMSTQKLRTPKALGGIQMLNRDTDKNAVLAFIQHVRDLYCATWSECVWQLASAERCSTKFIVSDHPVTVYNRACFPQSKWCRGFGEPDIRQVATHTIFPLSLNRVLLLTNLAWARNPYQSEVAFRPNAELFRETIFNLQSIQVDRVLSEEEVNEINFIVKRRAHRYIAAAEEEWLYPERFIPTEHWSKLGGGWLLMPDPRSMVLSGEVKIGFRGGGGTAFDAHGHRPWQQGFHDPEREEREAESFGRFQAEFAARFGPRRRGRAFEFGSLDPEEDSAEIHDFYLEDHRRRASAPSVRRKRP